MYLKINIVWKVVAILSRPKCVNHSTVGPVNTEHPIQYANKCLVLCFILLLTWHDDVIKRKHYPRCWPFVRGIHRFPVNSPHKGQWREALIFLFDLCPNKRLSKQRWCWWIETLFCQLWRHSNKSFCGFVWPIHPYSSGFLHWHCENHCNKTTWMILAIEIGIKPQQNAAKRTICTYITVT